MSDSNHNIPFQVENLIQNMMNKSEREHVRENYRMRLESIRDAIDASLKKYRNDSFMNVPVRKKRA